MSALLVGFGLGFFVGAQPGPVALLCIRSVLRGALAGGIAIGAGAALVDLLYASLGLAGAATLLEAEALRVAFGLVGAGVLAYIGGRTLWSAFRVRLGGESQEEVGTPLRAFATAVAATASNPLTIATWAAIFTAAGAAAVTDAAASASGAVLMLGGVALGTLTAFTALSLLVVLVRGRFGPRLLATVDVAAGAGLLGFAGLLGWRAVDDS
jgi:threonine/homoserine/homoserine lactone efflux protein